MFINFTDYTLDKAKLFFKLYVAVRFISLHIQGWRNSRYIHYICIGCRTKHCTYVFRISLAAVISKSVLAAVVSRVMIEVSQAPHLMQFWNCLSNIWIMIFSGWTFRYTLNQTPMGKSRTSSVKHRPS